MKKYVIILALILLYNPIFSQDFGKRLRLGIGASPSLSWMSSDYKNVVGDGVKLSVKYGINFDYRILDNYYFSGGLKMSSLNGKLKYADENLPFMAGNTLVLFNTDGSENVSIDYKLKYIEIPLGMKLKTNEIGYLTYFARFGLNPAINISAIGSANQLSIEDVDINDEVNFFTLGYHFGAGVEYALSTNFIFMGGISYNQGFIDVTSSTDGREKDKTVISSVALNFGIFF